jgi:hypothetical protein
MLTVIYVFLRFCLQVKSGTLFDNMIITDDPALAKTFAEETWGKHKEVCFHAPRFINKSRMRPV